jgi:hypothetical protein
MPMDKVVQDKVLRIAANKAIDNSIKLAVRKQFYVLKDKEVDLEIKQEEFSVEVNKFVSALDSVLSQVGAIETVPVVEQPKPVAQEQIILPPKVNGTKVRMQEDITDDVEDSDFEVPFEAEES